MIRVVLPAHLRTLAKVTGEVRIEVTGTVTTRSIANAAVAPAISQPMSVSTAATMATMVNANAARSASACAWEREDCASATRRMMPASAVRSPVPVTSTRSDPAPVTAPAMTRASTVFCTGCDSPVIIASFTSLLPSRTIPSAGMLAPGRMSTMSFSFSSEIGTSSVPLPTTRTAVEGSNFANSPTTATRKRSKDHDGAC